MSFICSHCNLKISLQAPGTKNRNHCPFCLYSLHVDDQVGDRKAKCKGDMKPIGKVFKPDGEEVIVHECVKCGFQRKNRIAGDDSLELVENLPVLDTTKYL